MEPTDRAFELLFEDNPLPMAIYDPQTCCYLAVNAAKAACYGYAVEEMVSHRLDLVFYPEDRVRMQAAVLSAPATGHTSNLWRLRRKDGSPVWIEARSYQITYQKARARLIVSQDVTEQILAETALREAERKYRSIFENAIDGIFQTTLDGRYLSANPALARIYGYDTPGEMLHNLQDITHQLYVYPERRQEFVRQLHQSERVSNFEAQVYRRDRSIIWIVEQARLVRDDSGKGLYYEGTVQDITERKRLEAERERLLAEALERSDHDPLTGLLNHRTFHKRYAEEIARAERDGTPLAVAVFDMDNFKFFNDSYGHAVGDDVLRQVAEALRRGRRSYDSLARFGGDEFALLMPGMTAEDAARTAERLTAEMEAIGYRPPNSKTLIPLSLSLGLAVYPDDSIDQENILEVADARLLQSKTGGDEQGEIESLRQHLTGAFQGFSMLDALVTSVDNKDRYTRRHSEDVMRHALLIAREMGVDEPVQQTIQVAALLHDVGKIGVPDRILRKPAALTDEEFEAVKQHPLMGAVIVGSVPGFEETLEAVRHHHERWDGQGYPFGLRGEETPLAARIMAVADAYSAMTMDRPYRKGRSREEALAELLKGAGQQWDPSCVAAFQSAINLRPGREAHGNKPTHTVDQPEASRA